MLVPGSTVSVAPAATVRLPLTTNGPLAAAHVVFAAMLPDTFWVVPSSYQISTDDSVSFPPVASNVSTVTVFTPGLNARPLMLQLRCHGTHVARMPFTFTL